MVHKYLFRTLSITCQKFFCDPIIPSNYLLLMSYCLEFIWPDLLSIHSWRGRLQKKWSNCKFIYFHTFSGISLTKILVPSFKYLCGWCLESPCQLFAKPPPLTAGEETYNASHILGDCSSQPSMVHWLSSSIFPFSSRYGDIRINLHIFQYIQA